MHDICHDVTIHASPADVFAAITRPQDINRWWTLQCEGMPRTGSEFRFYFGAGYDWYANVTACTPERLIEWKFFRADEDWTGTTLRMQVSDSGNATRLRFEHLDWSERNDHFRRSSYCWAQYLHLLKAYLEDGTIVPYADRNFG